MKTGKSPKSSAAAGQMKLDSFLRPTTKAGDKTDSDCQIIFVSPKKSDTQMSTGKRFRNSPLKVGVSCQIEKRPKVLRSYAKSKKCSTEVADDISDSEVTASNEVEFNHAFMEESAKSGVSLPNVSDEELCSDAKTPGNSRTPSAEVTDLNDSFCTLDIGELDRLVEEQLNEVEDKNESVLYDKIYIYYLIGIFNWYFFKPTNLHLTVALQTSYSAIM